MTPALGWRWRGRRSAREARRGEGRETRARKARAGESRRQGRVGRSTPVGWSQDSRRRVRREERRSAVAWLMARRAREVGGPG